MRCAKGTGTSSARLRELGVARIVLATGDRQAVADAITEGLDLDGVRAGLTPDQKVLMVLSGTQERSGDDGWRRGE